MNYSHYQHILASRRFLLLLIMIFAILSTSCQVAQETIGLGTATEGQLLIYTTLTDNQVQEYLKTFNAKYPDIKVNYVRGPTGVMTDRFFSEANNPKADVIWSLATTSILLAEWQGLLKGYTPKGLSKVNPRFRDPANPPNWVGMYVWMSAFCINNELIEELELPSPTSWQELLNPAYEGHIIMPNPNNTGTGFLALSTIFQIYNDINGWDYLDQLNKNIIEYSPDTSQLCSGKYPIGITYALQGITKKAEDERIEVVFPSEGSGWEMETSALVQKPKIKPAAKTFLDWAISQQAMETYAADWALTSARTDIPIPDGYPTDPSAQLLDSDFPWTAANRARILLEWDRRYDNK